MPTVFSMIIAGDLPGRFVWRDDTCVAIMTINPIAHGHALVIPRAEVDRWTDLDTDTAAHLMRVAHVVGQAQQAAFDPRRVGLIIAGLEVPHTHLHVIPMQGMADLDFARAQANPDPASLDAARDAIVTSLTAAGHDHGAD